MKKCLLFIWYSGWNISLPFDFASLRCGQLLQCSTSSCSSGAESPNRVSGGRESSAWLPWSLLSCCQGNDYPFSVLYGPVLRDSVLPLSSASFAVWALSIHLPRLFALQLADFWNSELFFLFHPLPLLASYLNREVKEQSDRRQARQGAHRHDVQSPWSLHSTHYNPMIGQGPNFMVKLQPCLGLAAHSLVPSVATTPSHDSSSSVSILERFCTWNSVVFIGERLVCGSQLKEMVPSHHWKLSLAALTFLRYANKIVAVKARCRPG